MPLVLPEKVYAAEVDRLREAEMEQQDALAKFWTKELQAIDPYLECWKAGRHTGSPDLLPGHWYIRRRNPETVDSYWPLCGDEGEYREPGEWMLRDLEAADLWNPRVHRDKEEARRRLREARRRAKAREVESRRDEMALAARAAKRMKSETGFTKRTDLKGKPTEHSR
jgi:hypothetical protein